MENKLPVIEVSGSPYEVGYQHGRACKEKIQQAIAKFSEYMRFRANLSKEKMIDLSSTYVPYAKEYAPGLMEELRGISDGSHLTFEEIFVWNSLSTDVMELWIPELMGPLGFGCTALALSGNPATEEGPFIAQNLDWPSNLQENAVLLKIHSADGSTSLIFSVSGRLGFSGLNDRGVGLCVNKLSASDNRVGVPNQFIFRKILEQKTIGESLGVILYAKRATGMNYVLADRDGEIFDIETTATAYDILYGFKGSLVHSNHYTADRLKSFERLPACFVDSIARLNRAGRLLWQQMGTVSLSRIKDILQDHANFPNSICRHSDEGADESVRMKTLVSIIINPREARAWCTLGNPCENAYVEYEI